jgi:hypothetical protein
MSPKSKNYKWQTRWTVDAEQYLAIYKSPSGAKLTFKMMATGPICLNGQELLLYTVDEMPSHMTLSDLYMHLAKLRKQAEDIYKQKRNEVSL